MEYRKITAIVHVNSLQAVEEALQHVRTAEVAVTRVKGYGDYKNFYSREWISDRARIEALSSTCNAGKRTFDEAVLERLVALSVNEVAAQSAQHRSSKIVSSQTPERQPV